MLQLGTPGALFDAGQINQAFELLKAVTVSTNIGIANMVRQDLSEVLTIQAPMRTPLRNVFKRMTRGGNAHAWRALVSNSYTDGSKFIGTTPNQGFFANGGLPTKTSIQYNEMSAPYKQVGDTATVSIFDQAAGANYQDQMARETRLAMMNAAMMEEWCIINGDRSQNALQFDGLEVQLINNVNDLGGASITINAFSQVQQGVWDQGGAPKMNVMSSRQKRKLNQIILATFYGIRQTDGLSGFNRLSAGLNVKSWDFGYGDTEIIPHQYIQPQGGSSAGRESIYVLDHLTEISGLGADNGNSIDMVDLLPMSSFDLAMTTSSNTKLIMEITLLAVRGVLYQGKLANVGAPAFQAL